MTCDNCGTLLTNPEGGIPLDRIDRYQGEYFINCPVCGYGNLWETHYMMEGMENEKNDRVAI